MGGAGTRKYEVVVGGASGASGLTRGAAPALETPQRRLGVVHAGAPKSGGGCAHLGGGAAGVWGREKSQALVQ